MFLYFAKIVCIEILGYQEGTNLHTIHWREKKFCCMTTKLTNHFFPLLILYKWVLNHLQVVLEHLCYCCGMLGFKVPQL